MGIMERKKYLCTIISGATAAAIKTAFDTWYNSGDEYGNTNYPVIVSTSMFGVTDLIVIYYIENE